MHSAIMLTSGSSMAATNIVVLLRLQPRLIRLNRQALNGSGCSPDNVAAVGAFLPGIDQQMLNQNSQ